MTTGGPRTQTSPPEAQTSAGDAAQAIKKLAALATHHPTYHPEFSYIKDGIYLGGLPIQTQFLSHGDCGNKLLNDCQHNQRVLISTYAIMKPREREGGIIPAHPVPDSFWREHGVNPNIFNITDEKADVPHDDIDNLLEKIRKDLTPTQNSSETQSQLRPACLVHCNLGVGRSFTVVALYLLKYGTSTDECNCDDLWSIFDYIASKRPQVNPSNNQIQFMIDFALKKLPPTKHPNTNDDRISQYRSVTRQSGMIVWKTSLAVQNVVSLTFEGLGATLAYAWSALTRSRTPSPLPADEQELCDLGDTARSSSPPVAGIPGTTDTEDRTNALARQIDSMRVG